MKIRILNRLRNLRTFAIQNARHYKKNNYKIGYHYEKGYRDGMNDAIRIVKECFNYYNDLNNLI